jgi:hypothetical protein
MPAKCGLFVRDRETPVRIGVRGGGCSPHRTGLSPCIWGKCREIFAKCREADIATLLKATRSQHLESRLPTLGSREEQGERSWLSRVVDTRGSSGQSPMSGCTGTPERARRTILSVPRIQLTFIDGTPEEGPSRRQRRPPIPLFHLPAQADFCEGLNARSMR